MSNQDFNAKQKARGKDRRNLALVVGWALINSAYRDKLFKDPDEALIGVDLDAQEKAIIEQLRCEVFQVLAEFLGKKMQTIIEPRGQRSGWMGEWPPLR